MLNKAYDFLEFDKVSKEDWLDKVVSDLKGKSLESLNWQIDKQKYSPFYTNEDIKNITHLKPQFKFPWLNLQKITLTDRDFIKNSTDALNNGADGLIINIEQHKGFSNFSKIYTHIFSQHCHLSLFSSSNCFDIYQSYANYIQGLNLNVSEVNGLGFWHELVNVNFQNKKITIDFTTLKEIIESNDLPVFRNLMVDVTDISGVENSPSLEIAFSLCLFVCMINNLQKADLNLDQIVSNVFFRLKSKKRYFIEIAKIRALKILTKEIIKQYDSQIKSFPHFHIEIENKGMFSFLSNTTEVMSSIIGGADSISVIPDSKKSQDLRIARNISNIIKEESYFDKSIDVSQGSYFIEYLTYNLAKSAWNIFSDWESKGDLVDNIENGYLNWFINNSDNN